MLTMIKSLGAQLLWARSVDVPQLAPNQEFVFAGMGGSGIAGDFAQAVTTETGFRVTVHKDYGPLPAWVDRVRPLVVALSYSGNTEETLDVAGNAHDRGLEVAVVTSGGALLDRADSTDWPAVVVPGGLQPRAALGYLFGSSLRILGVASGVGFSDDLAEAGSVAETTTVEGSAAWAYADQIASALMGRITVIYGGGAVSGTAAQRWKTQINENAKMPAWWSVFPELNHNEIVGWGTLPQLTRERIAVVCLTDASDDSRIESRIDHTTELTGAAVRWAGNVSSIGTSAAARIISLTSFGDLTSLMLAEKSGVDPVPVGIIEQLKKLLVEENK